MITPQRLAMLLVVGVLVIGGALWLASVRETAVADGVGDRVLPGLAEALNDLTEVRITKSGGPEVTLRRTTGEWRVLERDYPADAGKLRKLLLDLSRLTIVEPKTDEPANYAQLGVDEGTGPASRSTRVTLVTPERSRALIVGEMSGGREVFVRIAEEARAWLATPQILAQADPRRWIDASLVDLAAERVRAVAVDPPSGPAYAAERAKPEEALTLRDLPRGSAQSSADVVAPLAGLLANLNADDVRPAGASADGAAVDSGTKAAAKARSSAPTLRVTTFDGLTLALSGREDGDRRLVWIEAGSVNDSAGTVAEAARLNGRFEGRQFEIPRYQYESLFRPLSDFT